MHKTIHIQPLAPAKPPWGAACNGCGLCCLAEPCPLGVLLSRSRQGPCKALQWQADQRQYRCGALSKIAARPGSMRQHLWAWLVRRWIAAGVGCDCDLQPQPSATITDHAAHITATTNHHD